MNPYRKVAEADYAKAYQTILDLRNQLQRQKRKNMREHIFAMVMAGFDVGFNAILTIYPTNDQFQVEIYDPLDDDTEPFHETLKGFTMTMHRHGDRLERTFKSAEEAVDFYLQVHEWLTQSPKQ